LAEHGIRRCAFLEGQGQGGPEGPVVALAGRTIHYFLQEDK